MATSVNAVVRGFLCLFMVAGALELPASAADQGKEHINSRMIALAAQLEAMRADPGAGGVESEQYETLLADYRRLSESLGGDDPGHLMVQMAAGSFSTRSAPAVPPDPPGGPGACSATTTSFTSSPGTTITTGSPIMATLSVTTADTYLWDVDLNTDMPHTFAADLDVTLTSPASTSMVVTTDSGAGNDNIFAGTRWDDDAILPVTDFPHVNLVASTPLQPEGAFGTFIGEDPNGLWTLGIVDDAGGDDGTLVSWSLDITTLDAAPVFAAPSNFSSSPGTTITTGSPVAAPLTVSGLATFICDVNLNTNIPHTFAADLDITLTSPGGTTVVVTTDNGAGNDNIFAGTLWDDSAAASVTDFTHVNLVASTPLQPEGAFGAFIGEDPNGTWTLNITDDAGGDDGTLVSWSLDITTCTCEVPVELLSLQVD